MIEFRSRISADEINKESISWIILSFSGIREKERIKSFCELFSHIEGRLIRAFKMIGSHWHVLTSMPFAFLQTGFNSEIHTQSLVVVQGVSFAHAMEV